MGIGATYALAQGGSGTKAASLVQHDFGGAHLAVVVRAGDDRDARSAGGPEHAIENPPPHVDDVRAEAADEIGESARETRIRNGRKEEMGRGGVCAWHVRHRHRQTVDLGAVEILPIWGIRVPRGRHGHHSASAHLGAGQCRDRKLQAADVREEAFRGVQDAQPTQPAVPVSGMRPHGLGVCRRRHERSIR